MIAPKKLKAFFTPKPGAPALKVVRPGPVPRKTAAERRTMTTREKRAYEEARYTPPKTESAFPRREPAPVLSHGIGYRTSQGARFPAPARGVGISTGIPSDASTRRPSPTDSSTRNANASKVRALNAEIGQTEARLKNMKRNKAVEGTRMYDRDIAAAEASLAKARGKLGKL